MPKKIKVLIIDDSAFVRNVLKKALSMDPDIEVVGAAVDPYVARDFIEEHEPDVLTLDVEMPRMDGVEFLRKLMPQFPIPVVMVSSLTQKGAQVTLAALEAGAVDFVGKPGSQMGDGIDTIMADLILKIKVASKANVKQWKGKKIKSGHGPVMESRALAETTHKVIAIGASTGGTEATKAVITRFPATTPGVVIVQHMPPGFTARYAELLNNICQMEVKEAHSGDRIIPGRILIAPGNFQMKVLRVGGIYEVVIEGEGEKVNGHCPSVNVMMNSVAKNVGANAVGVMLTGMGDDGADGMLAMRQAGAHTVAQDEATSVVFGMPRVAYERGGVEVLKPLDMIATKVFDYLKTGAKKSKV